MGPLAVDARPRGFFLPGAVLILSRDFGRGLIRVAGGVLVLAPSLGRRRWRSKQCRSSGGLDGLGGGARDGDGSRGLEGRHGRERCRVDGEERKGVKGS